jgi:hypothetical protein
VENSDQELGILTRSDGVNGEPACLFLPRKRLVLFIALVGIVLWTSLLRYMDPIGEKNFPLLDPGAADFSVIFDGTKVFLDGHNPYYYRDINSLDRWNRADIIGGRWFRVSYQPSHFLLYIPIALLTSDNREAGRIIFAVSFALYFAMALLAWRLVLRCALPTGETRRFALLLLPVFWVLLAENIGTALSLARGQSDVINAAMCWGAIVLFLRGRRFWPMFLVTSAIALKGYPIILGVGLFFLGVSRRQWRQVLAGVLSAMVFWLLPVLPYLHDGAIAAYSHAAGFFTDIWFNQSFANVFFHVRPNLADPGQMIAAGFALCVSAGCWWHARQAFRAKDAQAATLWLCFFATASLATMVGVSRLSYIYNQILLLPGVLFLFTLGDQFWATCGFSERTRSLLFAAECAAGFLLFKYTLPPLSVPLAGLGNLVLVGLLAVGVVGRLRQGLAHPSR